MATSDATIGVEPDQYGQCHPVETPELVQRKQKEFEDELEKLPDKVKQNVKLAQDKCPELLTEKFKLMFLRTEVFNADLAAKRYCQYWDKRVEIFGPSKAFEPLTLKKALLDDDMALKAGVFQLVPERHDAMGRAILFIDASKQQDHHSNKYTRDSMARAVWYFIHASLENENVQKHGMIFLGWPHHAKLSQFDRGLAKIVFGSIQGALPTRLSAVHLIQPPSFFKLIFPIIKLFMTERTRKRFKAHFGSTTAEVVAKLETFGLDKDDLPKDIGGTVELDVGRWLEKRQAAGL